jgi:RNA polymerase sigma factor (sigma-70 family)
MLTDQQKQIIEDNISFAYSRAWKLYNRYKTKFDYMFFTIEDFKSIALYGLCIAAKNFKKDKGYKFTTYAAPVIDGHITRMLFTQNSVIKMPRIDNIKDYERNDVRNFIFGSNATDSMEEPVKKGEEDTYYADLIGDFDNRFNDVEFNLMLTDLVNQNIVKQKDIDLIKGYYLDGYSQIELGKKFKMKQGTVNVRIFRATRKIRNYLENIS